MTERIAEEWRSIPGYERTYEVSTLGRIRSHPRPRTRGGLRKLKIGKRGYPMVNLVQDGKQASHEVHRLVALVFLGPRPDGQEVRHLDGNPLNGAIDNLAYGTRSENNLDRTAHGADHNHRKTQCLKGHAYDELNTRIAHGRRYCRTCDGWTGHPEYNESWRP